MSIFAGTTALWYASRATGIVALLLLTLVVLVGVTVSRKGLVTSLLRKHIGWRTWRAVHWLAYAAYPVAVLHGFTSAKDLRSGWLLVMTVACLLAVAGAITWRIAEAQRYPGQRQRPVPGAGASARPASALQVPARPVPGGPVPGGPVPGGPVPGGPVPGRPVPGRPVPGRPVPGRTVPAHQVAAHQDPPGGRPGHQAPREPARAHA